MTDINNMADGSDENKQNSIMVPFDDKPIALQDGPDTVDELSM